MPEFVYRAARKDGSIADGQLDAVSISAAMTDLSRQGLVALSLEPSSGPRSTRQSVAAPQGRSAPRFGSQGVGARDVQGLTHELSVMLGAGLSLDRALRVLIEMGAKPSVVALTEDVLRSVKSGKGFSQALAPHQALFGDFYINMVKAGEAGGKLAEVLARLSEHLERARALRESVVSALIYPAILLVIALLSVALMLGFVVPQFETLFADMGEALPLPTQVIVAAGHFVADWWWLMLVAVAALVWAARNWAATPGGQLWVDRRTITLPVLGPIVRKFEITRFARSMGTLLGSGVPIVQAVRIATDTMENRFIRSGVNDVVPAIKGGGRVTEALAETGLFTPLALNMMRLGEETGRLDAMLLDLAKVHDAEVQAAIKRALTLLEPMLILLLGVMIGAIIVSILMGILSVNDLAG